MTRYRILLYGCMMMLLLWGGWFMLKNTSSTNIVRPVAVSVISQIERKFTDHSKPRVVASIPFWDQANAFASFQKNANNIDFLSLFWYGIREDGSIKLYTGATADPKIIEFARERGINVFILIANLPDYSEGGTWDTKRVEKVIGSEEARKQHIQDILSIVDQYPVDGINIDYEALKKSQREDFTLFMDDLSEELHKKGKMLSVAIHPKTSEDNPRENNGSWAQDLTALGKSADHLHVMMFDYHNKSTGPGPIAPLADTRKVIEYMVVTQKVPREKLYLGVPLYTYTWTQDTETDEEDEWAVKGLTYHEFQNYLTENSFLENTWDEDNAEQVYEGHDYAEYTEARVSDANSVQIRYKIAAEYGLGGVSFWRLGGEDERVWKSLHD